MPRCRQCRKFVSYGPPRLDAPRCVLRGDQLNLTATMILPCANCDMGLAAAEFRDQIPVAAAFPRLPDPAKGETAIYELRGDPRIELTTRDEPRGPLDRFVPAWLSRRHHGIRVTATAVQLVKASSGLPLGTPNEAPVVLVSERSVGSFRSLH